MKKRQLLFLTLTICIMPLLSVDLAYGRWPTVDPLAEKYYSQSPYIYCLNNPLRFTDPTGMAVEDKLLQAATSNGIGSFDSSGGTDWYFSNSGQHLGQDNKSTDNIRIMNQWTWDANKNSNATIDGDVGENNSTIFSQSGMSDEAAMKVYGHFNTTGQELVLNNNLDGNMGMKESTLNNRDKDGVVTEAEVLSTPIHINVARNRDSGLFDTAANVTSTFEHEGFHVRDINADPVGFLNRSRPQNELRAIEYQRSTPTFQNTTKEYKIATGGYKRIQEQKIRNENKYKKN